MLGFDKNDIHTMIDIETLDTTTNAIIVQIGMVLFNEDGLIKTKVVNLDWKEQMTVDKRTMSADTLAWWIERPNIQNIFTYNIDRHCLDLGLSKIVKECCTADYFWSKGSFDYDILTDAFIGCHTCFENPYPWNYRNIRDYRTAKSIGEMMGITESNHNSHDALGDAVNQAENLLKILKKVRAM